MKVKMLRLHPDAKVTKAHDSDFCYDCYAVREEEIAPGVWKYWFGFGLQIDEVVPKDIRIAFNWRARSSVWETGMFLSNGVGTIDQGYTGEVSAVFYHLMPNMPRYKVGDKVCQFCIEATAPLEFVEVDELKETDRGESGYGGSGRK